ncbi:hypothetical protein MRX96_001732 [Rhipicephalus microplus]
MPSTQNDRRRASASQVYPIFADLSPRDGRMRFLRASPNVLRDRRCLTGANRFHTLEACEVTCQKTSRA